MDGKSSPIAYIVPIVPSRTKTSSGRDRHHNIFLNARKAIHKGITTLPSNTRCAWARYGIGEPVSVSYILYLRTDRQTDGEINLGGAG